jgi:ubiquinone/menaquinone biosynthesis C-methylase UbiE
LAPENVSEMRPGGTLAIHEYSVRDSRPATAVWKAMCWTIIIPLAWWRTRDITLYRHLWSSVNGFDGVSAFRNRLAAAGFCDVRAETMSGWHGASCTPFSPRRPR